MDDIDRAGQCLLRATDMDFNHPNAHYYLGICCGLRQRYHDAAELFLHAFDIDENHIDALIGLTKTYIVLNRYQDAADTLDTVKSMTDDKQVIKPLLALIRKHRITEKISNLVNPRKHIHA